MIDRKYLYGNNELLYDEIPMTLAMNMTVADELMFITIDKMNIRDSFDKGKKRIEPIR